MNWSDNDEFWDALTPALAAPQRGAMADTDVAAIASVVELGRGTDVLDLGCGAGFHAIAFAERGCRVTGVDQSANLLRVGEANAAARSLDVPFVRADMREFVRRSAFDVVCSLYASFGYFDDESNRRVLLNVRTSLRRGGTLILDLIGTWQANGKYELEGSTYAVERELRGVHLAETWTINGKEFVATQRIYRAAELTKLLRDVGFSEIRLAASLDGKTPYTEDARRLVAFAS